MGVNRYNAEGYRDPTAYEALRNSDRFRITYPTGYMELNAENFFPCTVEKGKKVFRLVREHCTKAQQDELLALLIRKAKGYADKALALDRRLDDGSLSGKEYDDLYSQLKSAQRQHERIAKNIRQFTGRAAR
jgi:thermostable 8-oxoguanine DNA glycosylase